MDVNETKNKGDGEVEINLLDLFFYIWDRIWLVILITIMCGAAAYISSAYFMTEYYESSTTIWVMGGSDTTSSSTSITYSDIQVNTQMANDYINIITSRYVLNEVIEQLNLDYSVETLSSHISTQIVSDTRMIIITVTDEDPQRAQSIADIIFDIASERIVDVIKLDNLAVTRVDDANLPTTPSSPNVTRNTLIGAVAGIFISLVILVILYMLDDTIKTDEDILRYLGYTTLASIPEMDEEDSKKDRKKSKKSSKNTKKKDSSKKVSEDVN